MVCQLLSNAMVSTSVITLVGISFQIIFRVEKFFHFAHGGVLAVAPYLILLFVTWIGLPYWLSGVASVILSALLGLSVEFFCYRQIRKVNNSANTLLLCSLGVFIALQSLLALGFGSESRSIRSSPITEAWLFLGVRLTTIHLVTVICAVVYTIGNWAFMRFTKIGKQMEAVTSDPELARVIGINVESMHLWAMGLGSALVAITGILISYDVDMNPTMGMQPLMMGVVAVIIGGNRLLGTAGGSLLLGMARHLSVIWLSSKWQDAITFVILIMFLLIRPQGIIGEPLRKTSV